MPVFGNRMVVGTANYKHIQEHKAEVDDRETKLGEWEQEKRERLQRIRTLNESTKRRMSQRSTLSANSDGMRSGSSSRRGSAYTGDSENGTTVPAVTVTSQDSGEIVKDSGSHESFGSTDKPVSPSHLTISVPQNCLSQSVPTTPTYGRSSIGSIGSDITNTDVQEIVGGGRKRKRLDKNSYVCASCSIQ